MVIDVGEFQDLYPFQSNFHTLGDHRIHYLDEGQGDVLLMLHGNPTWSFYYRHLILGLRDRNRCVVPDHIGCGLSDKPQHYDYTLSRHIDNLESLVESLGLEKITLVMHDWGGAIGMGFAVRHPHKVRRLIVFNTAAFLSDRLPLSIRLCRLPVFGTVAIRVLNAFAGLAILRASKHPERMTRQVRAGYLAPYDSFANRIANLRFVQDIPMSPGVPSYPVVRTIQENLGRFRDRPMMIVWGKQDFVFDYHFLDTWREYFPDAQVHEVADAGHYVVEDAHERMVPWIREFLDRHPLQ